MALHNLQNVGSFHIPRKDFIRIKGSCKNDISRLVDGQAVKLAVAVGFVLLKLPIFDCIISIDCSIKTGGKEGSFIGKPE